MSLQPRKDAVAPRGASGSAAKIDGKVPNGKRPGFRTDTGISGNRVAGERPLQRWVPDSDEPDGSLEKPAGNKNEAWDQFAANEKLFGLRSNYHENVYTTAIDTSHPQYQQRLAAAEKKAREIERSAPTNAHVAEERQMDHKGGADGLDEEDKYSGVKRQDFPPLSNHDSNKYTPPARRAPTGTATVKGAPVDPAIISSQLRPAAGQSSGAKSPGLPTPSPTPNAASAASISKPSTPAEPAASAAKGSTKEGGKDADAAKTNDTTATKAEPAKANETAKAAPAKTPATGPTSTVNIEHNVWQHFKSFASKERTMHEKIRSTKARADKEDKLSELKKFAADFKLSTPVPNDLISIIAKDPKKREAIQIKARQNAEEMSRKEAAAKEKAAAAAKDSQAQAQTRGQQQQETAVAVPGAPTTPADNRGNGRLAGQPTPNNANLTGPPRHPNGRQSYAPTPQNHRGAQAAPQSAPRQNQQTGHLAQRLQSNQKMMQQGQAILMHNMQPPTAPALGGDGTFGPRQYSRGPQMHMGPRLNPGVGEFRPNIHAQSFAPAGLSTASSPHSAVNTVDVPSPAPTGPMPAPSAPPSAPAVRRKTKAVDVKKCQILTHIYAIPAPANNSAWTNNGGMRPSFDTAPVWKQAQDTEKPDSYMRLTYKDYFERHPYGNASNAAPGSTTHMQPHMAHQYQLPLGMQNQPMNGMHRHASHGAQMSTQSSQGMPMSIPHRPAFANGDDHQMMHSASSQSFASPKPGQAQMNYANANAMHSPAQMHYGQYMGPMGPGGAPVQMQYRGGYPQNAQFMPGHPGQPVMVAQYVSGPGHMMAGGPGMQMHPAAYQQFGPGGPPQQVMAGPGPNGYPSPRGHGATMMVPQGSQQGGQMPMYGMTPGMSPAMQFQQPAFTTPQPPGQSKFTANRRYSSSGRQY